MLITERNKKAFIFILGVCIIAVGTLEDKNMFNVSVNICCVIQNLKKCLFSRYSDIEKFLLIFSTVYVETERPLVNVFYTIFASSLDKQYVKISEAKCHQNEVNIWLAAI